MDKEHFFLDEKFVGEEDSVRYLPNEKIPLIGPIPEGMSVEEIDERTTLKSAAHVKIFELKDGDQLEEYEKLLQKEADGSVRFGLVEVKWVDEDGNWKILAHWQEFYKTVVGTNEKKQREVVNSLS